MLYNQNPSSGNFAALNSSRKLLCHNLAPRTDCHLSILIRIIMPCPGLRRPAHTRRTSSIRANRPPSGIRPTHAPTPHMRLIIRRADPIPDPAHPARQRRPCPAGNRPTRGIHLGDADLLDKGRFEVSGLRHERDACVEERFPRGDVGLHGFIGLYAKLDLIRERMRDSVAGEEDVVVEKELAARK